MNVYEKLAKARKMLKNKGLKMSGKNTYSNYEYFELADFIPEITNIEDELKLISIVNFDKEDAKLVVINCEDPKECIVFTSPMSTAELKGCHPVQNLGAVETYVRRYLYNIAYEIVESDALNKNQGREEKKQDPKEIKDIDDRALWEAENTTIPTKDGGAIPLKLLTTEQLENILNSNKPEAEKVKPAVRLILKASCK